MTAHLKALRKEEGLLLSESGKNGDVSVFKAKKCFGVCEGTLQCVFYCNNYLKFKYSPYV